MVRVGMVGYSEGNGHPFSFSAIINGYNSEGFKKAGWEVILNYLQKREATEFGFKDVTVTHAWTQKKEWTLQLCEACNIAECVDDLLDLKGKVDAVIVARDDYERHFEMAIPFLEDGTPVFIDKPLTLVKDELKRFIPFIEKGLLMSCSGMRYAAELDPLRSSSDVLENITAINGAVLFDWEKYGIHLLEAVLGTIQSRPFAVSSLNTRCETFVIQMENDVLLTIHALGKVPKVFQLDFFSANGHFSCQLKDNFSAFRRTLAHFVGMVKNGKPAIPQGEIIMTIKTLMAGRLAATEGRTVYLDEIRL